MDPPVPIQAFCILAPIDSHGCSVGKESQGEWPLLALGGPGAEID